MAWIMELLPHLPHSILVAFTVATLSFIFLGSHLLLSQKPQPVNTIARLQNKDGR
ncbi:MAG: hypothetical protein HUJ16_04040 [Kangiella sp.]|nr:hypothetical protein [Kangiella sp.]